LSATPDPPAPGSGAAAERPPRRLRFDRDTRLRSRRDFDVVFDQGGKQVNKQLVARIRELPTGSRSRLGLSVSRKVGDAPQRNRVKRCLRAAWREVAVGLEPPLELVLIARPGAAPTSQAEALTALRDLLLRLARDRNRRSAGAEDGKPPGPATPEGR